LRARLQSFRYPLKESPRGVHNMGLPAGKLNNGVILALAQFYAAQPPFSVNLGKSEVGAGIYQKGTSDVPACQTCHGNNAEGKGLIPRLAGQHKEYLQTQLQAFSMGARIAAPMTRHVWFMTPEQAKAVATFLGN
jgi:cytochrome c553